MKVNRRFFIITYSARHYMGWQQAEGVVFVDVNEKDLARRFGGRQLFLRSMSMEACFSIIILFIACECRLPGIVGPLSTERASSRGGDGCVIDGMEPFKSLSSCFIKMSSKSSNNQPAALNGALTKGRCTSRDHRQIKTQRQNRRHR